MLQLEGQRVLVTGATGQVARPIAERLAASNEVWAAARFTDEAAKVELEAQGIGTAVFTLGNADLAYLPDVDYVIHCAAVTAPTTAALGFTANAEGVGFLMKRYRDARAFFHMSSSGVYRQKDDPAATYHEDDELGGYTKFAPHYGMSKLAGEAVCRFQSRELGLPAIMGRLNVAYGTHGHGGLPVVLYEMFLKHGIDYQHVPGHQSHCSPIHEDDIADQVQSLLGHAAVGAPVVNLAGDEAVTLEAIIAEIEGLSGRSMTFAEADTTQFPTQIADTTRRLEWGGPCRVPWREGVRSALVARNPHDFPEG